MPSNDLQLTSAIARTPSGFLSYFLVRNDCAYAIKCLERKYATVTDGRQS